MAIINQLEEESNAKARELLPAARQRLQDALGDVTKATEIEQLQSSTSLDELVAVAEAELAQAKEVAGATGADDLAPERHPESSTNAEPLRQLQQKVSEHCRLRRCVEQGGEIPVHFITLTTAIYHWADLGNILREYEERTTACRGGRQDPLEPGEEQVVTEKRCVLNYTGVVLCSEA